MRFFLQIFLLLNTISSVALCRTHADHFSLTDFCSQFYTNSSRDSCFSSIADGFFQEDVLDYCENRRGENQRLECIQTIKNKHFDPGFEKIMHQFISSKNQIYALNMIQGKQLDPNLHKILTGIFSEDYKLSALSLGAGYFFNHKIATIIREYFLDQNRLEMIAAVRNKDFSDLEISLINASNSLFGPSRQERKERVKRYGHHVHFQSKLDVKKPSPKIKRVSINPSQVTVFELKKGNLHITLTGFNSTKNFQVNLYVDGKKTPHNLKLENGRLATTVKGIDKNARQVQLKILQYHGRKSHLEINRTIGTNKHQSLEQLKISVHDGLAEIDLTNFDPNRTYRVNLYLDEACVAEQLPLTNGKFSHKLSGIKKSHKLLTVKVLQFYGKGTHWVRKEYL